MGKKQPHKLFIEARDNGFVIMRPGAERASFVLPTQRQAEQKATKMDPNAGIDVSRVRKTSQGRPDQWRKRDR